MLYVIIVISHCFLLFFACPLAFMGWKWYNHMLFDAVKLPVVSVRTIQEQRHRMNSSITRLSIHQIEEHWSNRIREEYLGLDDAKNLIGFLKNPAYMVSFRYALCRFLRRKYGARNSDGSTTLIFRDFCKIVQGDGTSPSPEDVETYISLMLLLAQERGMKGELKGKHLRLYLLGKQENVSRDTLFKMAFAFDMDCEVVCELLESLDEGPYNFRRAEECISYFCQYSGVFNTWDYYQEFLSEYEASPVAISSSLFAGQSHLIQDNIENILLQELTLDKQKEVFLNYLKTQKSLLTGFPLTAYRELESLLDDLQRFTGAIDDTDLVIKLWEPIWVQFYTKKGDSTGINRSDFVPWKDLLDLPKSVYAKPIWRARLKNLRAHKVPVEKRDILFLNCMRWANDPNAQNSEGGKEAMQEFIAETNDILLRCGLSAIYPPNPYDRMILLAICSPSPYEILTNIFETATDEQKLGKKLSKS